MNFLERMFSAVKNLIRIKTVELHSNIRQIDLASRVTTHLVERQKGALR